MADARSSPESPASSAPISPRRLLARGATRGGGRQLHRLLRSGAQAGEPGATRRPARASGWCAGISNTIDLAPLLAEVEVIYHQAAQAGVRSSWGREFTTYTRQNVDATQRLLERCREQPVEKFVYASSSSVYGETTELPMREDAPPVPTRPTGSPSSRASTWRGSITGTSACRRCRSATSRSTARASAPTWPSGGSSAPSSPSSRSWSTATASRPATSPSSPMRWRPISPPPSAGGRGRCTTSAAASRVTVKECLEILSGSSGRGEIVRGGPPGRRRDPHLRRYHPRPHRARVHAARAARRGLAEQVAWQREQLRQVC